MTRAVRTRRSAAPLMCSRCRPVLAVMVLSLVMKGPIFAFSDESLAVASLALLLGQTIAGMSVSFQERGDPGNGLFGVVPGDDDAPAGGGERLDVALHRVGDDGDASILP